MVPLAVLTLSVSHAAKLQVAVADPSGRPLADAVVYATRVDDSSASPKVFTEKLYSGAEAPPRCLRQTGLIVRALSSSSSL